MKTQFVPYEQALALKELGFDETCIMAYYHLLSEDKKDKLFMRYNDNKTNSDNAISAPLYQQAFKFFRDKYELYYTIEGSKKYGFAFFIYYENDDNGELKSKEYSTYEEAEQECLIKLIEITKEKK